MSDDQDRYEDMKRRWGHLKPQDLHKLERKGIILSFLQKVIESDDPFLVETLIDEIRFGTPERLTAFIEKVEGGK